VEEGGEEEGRGQRRKEGGRWKVVNEGTVTAVESDAS
jgi:hypothetical protein